MFSSIQTLTGSTVERGQRREIIFHYNSFFLCYGVGKNRFENFRWRNLLSQDWSRIKKCFLSTATTLCSVIPCIKVSLKSTAAWHHSWNGHTCDKFSSWTFFPAKLAKLWIEEKKKAKKIFPWLSFCILLQIKQLSWTFIIISIPFRIF